MGQEIAVPAALANYQVPDALKGLGGGDDLSAGLGQGYPIVHYRGKNWSLQYRGETKIFINAHDRQPTQRLDVIILGAAPFKSKSYFGVAWDPQNPSTSPPKCWSLNGKLPDQDVPLATKQADVCEICPRNEWKMQASGKEGRECQDFKRLAVFIMPHQTQLVFGQVVTDGAFLRVPAGSLQALAKYSDWLTQRGFAPVHLVTQVTFNPEKSHPEMVFGPAEGENPDGSPKCIIPAGAADFIAKLATDPVVKRIVGLERFVEGPRAIVAPIAPATAPPTVMAPVPVQPTAPPQPAVWTPPPQPAPAPVSSVQGRTADPWAGLGTGAPPIDVPPAVVQAPQAATQTVADTGKPLEAGPDLDALVKTLIG